MTDNNIKKWYVVRAVSGQENKVKNYIETEIARLEMTDYLSQVLVPMEKVVKATLPFYLCMIVTLILITFIPGISMLIPNLIGK